jgi:hypothetical protein
MTRLYGYQKADRVIITDDDEKARKEMESGARVFHGDAEEVYVEIGGSTITMKTGGE